eukprot:12295297-Alexandrium_andersonii.AAC.1
MWRPATAAAAAQMHLGEGQRPASVNAGSNYASWRLTGGEVATPGDRSPALKIVATAAAQRAGVPA